MPRYGQPNISNVPYGNAFLVQTPEIDRARDLMFQQAQQQRLLAMHTSNQLDNEMSREFAKVRSVDSPAVIDSYNKYKELKKQVLFDPRVQRDSQLYNQLNNQANQALADTYRMIDKSTEYQQMQRDLMTMYKSPHGSARMVTDAGDRIMKLKNTPVNRLEGNDLANPDSYMYKDTTDFGKLDTQALKASQFDNPIDTPDPNDKYTTHRINYKSFNPQSYHDSMIMQASKDPNFVQSAEHMMGNLADHGLASEDAVNQEIAQMTPEEWKQKTGSEKPVDLEPKNPDSPAERAASYLTKLKLLHYSPSATGKTDIVNRQLQLEDKEKYAQRMLNQRESFEQSMEGLRDTNIRNRQAALLNLQRFYKRADYETQNATVDQYFNRITAKAATGQKQDLLGSDGSKISGYEIQLPDFLQKETEKQIGPHKEKANKFLYDDKTETIRPIFTATNEDGKTVVDATLSKPIPIEGVFKPAFHKEMASTDKPIAQTQKAAPPAAGKHPLPSGKPKTVKQNGVTYTWNENSGQYE